MATFPRTEPIGAQFGVVLVIHRGHPFEVATFRSDEAYVDGRRPTGVIFTDAKQDVLRRDFTINGLLYDPDSREIVDYVGGREDIRAGVVRAIGDPKQRFEEDKLRLLRAIRFGARLGYRIEAATWQAVQKMAPQIHQVSSERIRDEVVRILTEGQAAVGFALLVDAGLAREILPELEWSEHIEACLRQLRHGAWADFAVAVLLHDVPIAKVHNIVERLKFSRIEAQHITALVSNLPKFETVRTMSVSELKRFFRVPRFADYLELARIHSISRDGDLVSYQFAAAKYAGWTRDDIGPAPLISGEDLIRLGYTPGPIFKEILTRVEDEQLEGRLRSHDQALDFVRAEYGKVGPS
jgi:poly(A) polymerase